MREESAPSGVFRPVSTAQFVCASIGFAWLCWIIKRSDGFIFLDYVNLAFHEAGHPFFGLFGETLGLYGGTIGQLVFPVVSLIAFLRRGDTVGVSVAGVWFFENFFNIARYMADARVQQLPLVGGGEHDWWHIFTRWGVLDSDTKIAHAVSGMGWIGLIGVWWWLAWHFFRTMQDVQNGPSARPQVKEAPEV